MQAALTTGLGVATVGATMHLPEVGLPDSQIIDELSARLDSEPRFDSGEILGSMCSPPDPLAAALFERCLDRNAGDPDLFPGTRDIEQEVVSILGSLLGSDSASGSLLTGGTEANLVALWAAKRRDGGNRREVVLPESAHFSFDKAADLMGLTLRRIPLDDRYRMDARRAAAALSPSTLAIVAVAGSTALGAVDPIEELADLAVRNDLYLHVDAAFGGFVLPFLRAAGYPSPPFDFSLRGVSSITIDPHKMGRAPIPAGGLLFRDKHLAQYITTRVHYLTGGAADQRSLVGTRSGGAAAAVWASLHHLGRMGFVGIVRRAMELTSWLAAEIRHIPGYSIVTEPVLNILGLRSNRLSARELADALRARHFHVAVFEDFIRIVLMPHLSTTRLIPFLDALRVIERR